MPDLDAIRARADKATKVCKSCNTERSSEDFYRDKRARDGLYVIRKDCHNAKVNTYRREHRVKASARDQAWREANQARVAAYKRKWLEANRTTKAERMAAWRAANPEKNAAHTLLNRAVRDGQVTRPDACSRCGSAQAIEGHHGDYARPYEVTWLCRRCHRDEHTNARAALAAQESAE